MKTKSVMCCLISLVLLTSCTMRDLSNTSPSTEITVSYPSTPDIEDTAGQLLYLTQNFLARQEALWNEARQWNENRIASREEWKTLFLATHFESDELYMVGISEMLGEEYAIVYWRINEYDDPLTTSLIDRNGDILLDLSDWSNYRVVYHDENTTLIAYAFIYDGPYTLIELGNDMPIATGFTTYYYYSNGVMPIHYTDENGVMRYEYIDMNGNTWMELEGFGHPFFNGYAIVESSNNDSMEIQVRDDVSAIEYKFSYIDTNGTTVLPNASFQTVLSLSTGVWLNNNRVWRTDLLAIYDEITMYPDRFINLHGEPITLWDLDTELLDMEVLYAGVWEVNGVNMVYYVGEQLDVLPISRNDLDELDAVFLGEDRVAYIFGDDREYRWAVTSFNLDGGEAEVQAVITLQTLDGEMYTTQFYTGYEDFFYEIK